MIGKVLGKYRIVEKIGQGGMGQVFRAVQEGLEREVALKVLAPNLLSNKEMVARFKREILICARLQHDNLVKVFDGGEAEGMHFFAMEYFPGEALHRYLARKGELPVEMALRLTGQLGRAIDHIHREGLIHRDIKLSNVMIGRDGTAKLMDFGLARDTYGSALTQSGALLGTLGYMSPEMVRGDQVDLRSDIYQIGVVLFELLTQKLPVDHGGIVRMAQGIEDVAIPKVRSIRSDVSASVDHLLQNTLTLRPEDRYGRCKDFLKDLDRAISGGEVALLPAVAKRAASTQRSGSRSTGTLPANAKPDEVLALVKKARRNRLKALRGKSLYIQGIALAVVGWLLLAGGWLIWRWTHRSTITPAPTVRESVVDPSGSGREPFAPGPGGS